MSETKASELVMAISDFLRDRIVPAVEGFNAYNARVAANGLKIVARELDLKPELEALDEQAGKTFGINAQADEIAMQLSLLIKDGAIEIDDTLLHYLRQRTLKRMEIDNPKYSGYREALKRWQ